MRNGEETEFVDHGRFGFVSEGTEIAHLNKDN